MGDCIFKIPKFILGQQLAAFPLPSPPPTLSLSLSLAVRKENSRQQGLRGKSMILAIWNLRTLNQMVRSLEDSSCLLLLYPLLFAPLSFISPISHWWQSRSRNWRELLAKQLANISMEVSTRMSHLKSLQRPFRKLMWIVMGPIQRKNCSLSWRTLMGLLSGVKTLICCFLLSISMEMGKLLLLNNKLSCFCVER